MREHNESFIKFIDYSVIDANFKLLTSLDDVTDDPIPVKPKYERLIKAVNDTRYEITLSVFVGGEDSLLPFQANVKLVGFFELVGVEDKIAAMKLNATAILFPYLRSTLSLLTNIANINPLLLSVVNISELFEEKQSKPAKKTQKKVAAKE